MHKTIGSELPPSDENTVLVYEWLHLWERDENSPPKRREYKVYFKTLKIPASLLLWYTWLSASSESLLTNSVLRVEYFISLRFTLWVLKGK
jgi:hypothetical protein